MIVMRICLVSILIFTGSIFLWSKNMQSEMKKELFQSLFLLDQYFYALESWLSVFNKEVSILIFTGSIFL